MKSIQHLPFKVLSFDCYGTLIDWETGILNALHPLFLKNKLKIKDTHILEWYANTESALQKKSYRPYKDILVNIILEMKTAFGITPTDQEKTILVASLANWLPFLDTVAALKKLKTRFKLAIVTNSDDDLFLQTQSHLIPFDFVITSQQIKSYKPGSAHFEELLKRTRCSETEILHIAQSLYHDIEPAKARGFYTVWINRRQGKKGCGATPESIAEPDLELPDLKSLTDYIDKISSLSY